MSHEIALERNTVLQPARVTMIAFAAILAAHAAVDALSAMVPPALGLLEVRLHLTTKQAAWLMGIGPLCSGLAQPICALLSDRFATRQLGVWGVAIAVLGIGSLGFANSFLSLVVIYALGVIGIGMFHPVGAATIGHLWRERRSSAVSYFFVSGMLGSVAGALLGPRILSLANGFELLPLLVAPILLVALLLHRSYAALQPLHVREESATSASGLPRVEWAMVAVLYVSAALRFCVNMALIYLFVRWVENHVAAEHAAWPHEAVAKAAAPLAGNMNAATFAGMAMGGMLAGVLVRNGREKWPMVLVPVLFAPVIGLFPFLPFEAGYVLAALAGIGFAAMIPVTIALAQQLMPRRTNLASSLMMGGAWAVALLGPTCAEIGVARFGLQTTFLLTGATLALSGIVCLPVRNHATR